jgi:hypothetical protein
MSLQLRLVLQPDRLHELQRRLLPGQHGWTLQALSRQLRHMRVIRQLRGLLGRLLPRRRLRMPAVVFRRTGLVDHPADRAGRLAAALSHKYAFLYVVWLGRWWSNRRQSGPGSYM